MKYYIAVPNYEREYAEGETIVDDFQLDEWMSAGVSVAASEKSVDFTFPQHRSGYVVRDSDVVHRQRAQSELFEKLSESIFFL